MIAISGDMLEGGGQIVRTSVALASLSGKDVHIDKIRANRPNPGLQAQHVIAVKALASVSNAETEGLVLGSRNWCSSLGGGWLGDSVLMLGLRGASHSFSKR